MFHTWWPKTRPWCAATRAPSGCGAQRPPSARALRALAHGRSDVSESFRVECKFPLFIKCVTLPIIGNTSFNFTIRYYNGSFWHQNWVPTSDTYGLFKAIWAKSVPVAPSGKSPFLGPYSQWEALAFGTDWHIFFWHQLAHFGTRWHLLFPCVGAKEALFFAQEALH